MPIASSSPMKAISATSSIARGPFGLVVLVPRPAHRTRVRIVDVELGPEQQAPQRERDQRVGQQKGEVVDQAGFPPACARVYPSPVDAPLRLSWQEAPTMPRVLHVLDHSLPLHSGYAFRTRAIMAAQRAAGIDARGITGLRHDVPGPAVETAENLTFHRTPGEPSGPVGVREWREIGALAEALDRLVEEWRPDVLHAHSPALCGIAALRVARRHRLPLVY